MLVQPVGNPIIVAGTSPAAGANFTYTIPTGWLARLVGLQLQLVTDANAANRYVELSASDGATGIPLGFGSSAHAASLTWIYTPFIGAAAQAEGTNGALKSFPLALNVWLKETWIVGISVRNIQVGDQLSGIVLWFERFIAT